MTDPSDIQSSSPMTPTTTSQPMTPTSQIRTMHFEAAVTPLTEAEQLAALVTQMAALTTIFDTIKTNNDKLEKYKRDLFNQLKDDVMISTAEMETSIDSIDAK
eukprot:scaffold88965_cov47-Attheya_sp.AAC.1